MKRITINIALFVFIVSAFAFGGYVDMDFDLSHDKVARQAMLEKEQKLEKERQETMRAIYAGRQ